MNKSTFFFISCTSTGLSRFGLMGAKQFVHAVLCKRLSCFSKPKLPLSKSLSAGPHSSACPPPFSLLQPRGLSAGPPALQLSLAVHPHLLTPHLLDETFLKAAATSLLLPRPFSVFSSGCLPVSLRIYIFFILFNRLPVLNTGLLMAGLFNFCILFCLSRTTLS